MMRYSAASSDVAEILAGEKDCHSPVAKLIANSTAPPTRSCAPDVSVDGWPVDVPRDSTVAMDQEHAEASNKMIGVMAVPASPASCHAIMPTPKIPGANASRMKGEGRSPCGNSQSISWIQN